jgi:alkylation response protein AidB-like acyl-CoA dehydrogenase
LGVAIDDACGGGGGGVLDLCALAREFGRAYAAVPFASSICTFAELLERYGSPAQKERWLPRVAHGNCIGCVAIADGASTG